MTDSGAHFFRCDFQVHTPRDANWNGTRPTGEVDRKAWAESLIATCRAKDLHAIAITDHHDFAMVHYVREAALAELNADGKPVPPEERAVVFPGLELTLSVPCQALLLLDADFPADRLDGVLARLAIQAIDSAELKLPPVQPIDIPLLSGLYAELDKEPWLRGRYIVFPNVTDKGHQTLLRAHMHHKYKEMPCVGGYLDGTVDKKVGDGNRQILDGLNAAYGNKRIALIQTSDCRREDFEDLGKHSTWIKWSVPTAEALRQACLAQESRISQSQPELPTTWVSRVTVDNSLFLGPIELELNPEFNAIIGGRGTGKSTLLDYLRWALCDLPAEAQDEEIGNPSGRRRRLITTTLAPTESTVEVHFTINAIPHVVRRSAKTGDLALKVGDADFANARESEVRELLPIQAYSQKQLSSVSVRVDELTRFVTAPIRRQLATLDGRIDQASGRVRENYATLQRRRQVQNGIRRLELSENSLGEQAENLRNSLEDVDDADRAILDAKPLYDASHAATERLQSLALRGVDEVERALGQVASLSESSRADALFAPELEPGISTLRQHTTELLEGLRTALASAVESARAALSAGSGQSEAFAKTQQLIAQFEESYADVKERSTAHSAKLAELAEVEQQHASARRSLRAQREDLRTLGRPDEEHARLLHEMFELMEQRSLLLAAQCQSLSDSSAGLLRATLRRGQGLTILADQFRNAVAGSGLRGNRVEDLFSRLATDVNPLATWESAVTELESLTLTNGEAADITSERFPVLARLGLPPADLRRIASRLTSDGWLSLALTPISDHPSFEYQTKEDQFIEFAAASAGQQATALLRVLLAQSGPPLVIDQPEDDLDSEVVLNVVEQIWTAKRRRQLIFASHNANLVVNGDAELVIHCDYRVRGEQSRGEIKDLGAIDIPVIREAITRVMEGGEKAFRLRANKYGF